MTATLASDPTSVVVKADAVTSSVEPRKRTIDEIVPESAVSNSAESCQATVSHPPAQKVRRVSTDIEASSNEAPSAPMKIPQANAIVKCISKPGKITKKPQMKYDPDVPMTKEEAALWRREQRRKRNRESAAASRQRQRDRIVELESEVEEWKIKYEQIMHQIRDLEHSTGRSSHPSPAHRARDFYGPPPLVHHHHHHAYAHPPFAHHHHPRSAEYDHHSVSASGYGCPPKVTHLISRRTAKSHLPVSYHDDDDVMYNRATISPHESPYASPAPQDDSSSDEHEDHHFIDYRSPGEQYDEYQHSSKISSRPAMSRINHFEHGELFTALPVQTLTA